MDRQWSCTPSRHSVKANWNRNQRWRSRIWAGVSTRCRTSCLIRCTAWWHILTWAWGTSGGGFNNCYRGRRGGGRDGEGEGRGGKEDIYVLLTEWRRKGNKIHARGQKRGKKRRRKKNKGQGMDTNPLHASRTGVAVAKQKADQTCSYTSCFHLPPCSGHAFIPISAAAKWRGKMWEAGPRAGGRLCDWLTISCFSQYVHRLLQERRKGCFPSARGNSSFQSDCLRNSFQTWLSLTLVRRSKATSRNTTNPTLWQVDCGKAAAEASLPCCVSRV